MQVSADNYNLLQAILYEMGDFEKTVGLVKHDRLLRRVGGVASDWWHWEYILPQL